MTSQPQGADADAKVLI